jgi:signal transduction histidine kinase
MPATVLVLGVMSIAMLVWIDRISQRQRVHFAVKDVLTDLQIKVATSHLWFDEAAINHNRHGELERAWSDFREATRLSELLLTGGDSRYKLPLAPASDPELRRPAEDIRRLLTEIGVLARALGEKTAWSGAALETVLQRCDAIFDELERRAAGLERLVEDNKAADFDHSRRLFLGTVVAWASIVGAATTGLWHRERRRRESEAQLRQLSTQLLTAHETERRRISTELHDELGHSLVLMKLQLACIAKNIGEDPSAAREECDQLAGVIAHVIEDVRRLSRDLRPAVLEDLGLSAALGWLVDNCVTDARTSVTASIAEIDDLLWPEAHAVVYRIVQEALTNVAKHAGATRTSLNVECQSARLSVLVEDDGNGFDVKEALTRPAAERGLGLSTMQERARMLGGQLDVRSEQGKGTRITLTVPVRKGHASDGAVPNRSR